MNDRVFYLLCSAISAIIVIIFQLVIGRRINIDVEELKTSLNYSTQSKLSLKLEERNAIISCYDKCSYWFHVMMEVRIYDVEETDLNKLKSISIELDNAYFQYFASYRRMSIFVKNTELLKAFSEHSKVMHKILQDSKKNIKKYEVALTLMINLNESSYSEINEYQAKYLELKSISIDVINELYNKRETMLMDISQVENDLTYKIRSHLESMLVS